jgi:hypothetical protein
LPTPEDDTEARVVRDIHQHGWHVVIVRSAVHDQETEGPWSDDPRSHAAYEALFAYTVGLEYSFGHPEVVLVGGWQRAHPFLNAVGDLVRDGRRFLAGDTSDQVLDGLVVRFDAVSEICRNDLLTWAHWAVHRQHFEALQLVLPDTSGRWPGDPDYNGFAQPALT